MMFRRKAVFTAFILICLILLFYQHSFAQDDDTTTPETAQALVIVDSETIADTQQGLFGTNILGTSDYGDDGGGVWSPQAAPCGSDIVGCYNPAPFAMLGDSGAGLLRFPGGRSSRHYIWEGGVGQAIGRDYLFGTDEFLFLSRILGATPIITVSAYDPETGDFGSEDAVTAAAQWVNYVNNISPYGPVTYWEIDSDTWENSTSPYNPDIEYKRVPPEAYAEAFLAMSYALKQADPSIKVGAVSYENKDIQDTFRLLEYIAASEVDPQYWPDFLVMEFFRPNHDSNLCNLWEADLEAELSRLMAAAFASTRELDGRLEDLFNAIETVWGGIKDDVPVVLGAYNTQLVYADTITNYPGDDDAPDCPFRNLSHSLGAAIFNADVLLTLLPYTDNLLGAGQWNFMDNDAVEPGHYGSVYLNEGEAIARPNELVMKMFGSDFEIEQVYDTTVITSTFDNDNVGGTPAYESISVGPSENYIRVRLARISEPTANTPICGPDNTFNPDPTSTISGIYGVDNFRLTQDNLPPQVATNLIVNGDFEQDMSVGWQTNPDPAGVTTSRECIGGNCWVQAEFANAAENNPSYLSQVMQTVEVEPGERYSLNFEYRTQNVQVKTQNLLCDPSWEYTSTPGAFNNSYWVQYGSTPAPATIIDEDCFDGDNCVRVPIVDNPEYYHIRQRYTLVDNVFPELADPDTYRVVGYVKTQNLDAAVTIEAQARNAGDVLLQSADSYGVFGDSNWQFQEYTMKLASRGNTAFINVHLRRKEGRKDNGLAFFDDVRMYRGEENYAPRVAIDICQDADCANKRTIYTDGVTGSRSWRQEAVAGTPLISALAGSSEQEVNLILINKDLTRTVATLVNLEALGLEGEYKIYRSLLSGESTDAVNEVGDEGPEIGVTLSGGEYLEDFDGESFIVQLPPHSITGIKLLDPTIVGDDEVPDDDTTPDDDDDNDTTPIDDDTVPDDDDDDDVNDDDDDDDGESCCGC